MTVNDSDTRQDLIDHVLEQIRADIESGDLTAIEEMIKQLPNRDLVAYLPEGVYNA